MTALTTDIPAQAPRSERIYRPSALTRFVMSFLGAALMFSSFGLWLVPGSDGVPELTLMKLGLSVFLLIGGLCCFASTRPDRA